MALTLTTDDLNAIADYVWDELLTPGQHNNPNSAGRRLRQVSSNIVWSGSVVSSTTNTVVLDSSAADYDAAYDPALVVILDGSGRGQGRGIFQYEGSTRKCWLDRDWKIQPPAGSEYLILAWPGREHVNEGVARGGTQHSIRLNASASTVNDAYIHQVVFIRSGTGQDQVEKIQSYDGATQTAYINDTGWSTIPDATSCYVILPSVQDHLEDGDLHRITTHVWDNVSAPVRTLTEGAPATISPENINEIASAVWNPINAPVRTLSQSARQIEEILQGSDIVCLRGDTLIFSLTGLGNISSRTKLFFTVKKGRGVEDVSSLIQIEETDGLLYLNEDESLNPFAGNITVDDEVLGNITITLDATETYNLPVVKLVPYDVQMISAEGVRTLSDGFFSINPDVTRSIGEEVV